MNRKRANSVVGLQISRHRAVAVELHRRAAGVQHGKRMAAPLSVDVLSGDKQLAGRELRTRLDEAGIRTRACIVCLPADWTMVHTVEIPAGLGDEDVQSLLDIEAERAFPFPPDDLVISVSRFRDTEDKPCATLLAVSRSTLSALESVLREARLQPVGITSRAAVLLGAAAQSPAALLYAGEDSIEFALGLDGGIGAVRAFPAPTSWIEQVGDDTFDELLRDLRITFRRLAGEVIRALGAVRLVGPPMMREKLKEKIEANLAAMGLSLALEEEDDESAAPLRAAAEFLHERDLPVNFHRPRPGRLQQSLHWMARRGILMRAAGVAAACLLLLAGTLVYRQARLAHLEKQWRAIEADVVRLEDLQERIRARRTWYDSQPVSLDIALGLTQAFPESGEVWARSIEIKDQTRVVCSGLARSNADCLRMLEALRRTPGVEDLQLVQIRGDNPVQFSLSYRWNPGVSHGG